MAWRFRKSTKIGPVRVNFSKRGVGYSVGNKFFRTGKRADGRYSTTTSIPGTGLYNYKTYPKKNLNNKVLPKKNLNIGNTIMNIFKSYIAIKILIALIF